MFTIREWRRVKDLTQDSVAEALGVSVNTLKRWEDDSSQITIANCYKLASILGVRFEDIIFIPNLSTES